MISEDDFTVRLVKLPRTVEGFVSPSPDGFYNVYLNQNLTYERRHSVLSHELNHIMRMDFSPGKTLYDAEF